MTHRSHDLEAESAALGDSSKLMEPVREKDLGNAALSGQAHRVVVNHIPDALPILGGCPDLDEFKQACGQRCLYGGPALSSPGHHGDG